MVGNQRKAVSVYKINPARGIKYFVTLTVLSGLDIFTKPVYFGFLIKSLKFCQQRKSLAIYAYVIMTNHLHLIVSSSDKSDKGCSAAQLPRRQRLEEAVLLTNDGQPIRKTFTINPKPGFSQILQDFKRQTAIAFIKRYRKTIGVTFRKY
ncbi:MAG: hypothetical protein UV78_C0026G0008 [Parcubacteria group bacterium GW2011_GWA2_43_17]|nr:MAG: hypothetical protein UV78_C0026G0008 [Parcubacteria group bacterium GW2011_GWA2_43_17]KKT94277.1 MAG: hypothetical protein UW91_C0004G0009 [Parcubacteria group bacterium GW2011_GWF2_45_11]KKT98801.1 MAG: hypothetical protein UW98_C0002G0009 [Parcubacteria group bacterium GW2011_GWC2_45_15]OGY93398.1 MAG: hypothetical protein A3J95_00075 [Candidatus Komeilibacteria bacterium RIFOXYC2_FULL_45_12]OGY94553.1 MAG: hypothetical protein A2260_00175 [Candidatus Komeilibacteria bacterium RIFOXYA